MSKIARLALILKERSEVSDYVPEAETTHIANTFKVLITSLRKVEREAERDDSFGATMSAILKQAFEGKDIKRELDYLFDAVREADIKTV